jgi:hypothetical protein
MLSHDSGDLVPDGSGSFGMGGGISPRALKPGLPQSVDLRPDNRPRCRQLLLYCVKCSKRPACSFPRMAIVYV